MRGSDGAMKARLFSGEMFLTIAGAEMTRVYCTTATNLRAALSLSIVEVYSSGSISNNFIVCLV